MKNRVAGLVAILLLSLMAAIVPPASPAVKVDTAALRNAVTLAALRAHQAEFQKFANRSKGTRAAGTRGYDLSAGYVFNKVKAAGYEASLQQFDFDAWRELSPAVLEQLAPSFVSYTNGEEFLTMEFSGAGDVTAGVTPTNDIVIPSPAPNASNSGCELSDFPAATAGTIALIQRGTCTFGLKALNAQAVGAAGVIIFNEGNPGRTGVVLGTLGGTGINIPVVFVTFALGSELYNLRNSNPPLLVRVKTDTLIETVTTTNVLAETPGGRSDRVMVIGAHLDSVQAGPGINDNGSGSAVILEIALQMAKLGIKPVNKVRFAWWGAEESGLIGSEFYVSQLSDRGIKDIALNLNFDMLGSPNFVRFVYDGDGSDTPIAGPTGSAAIEDVYLEYFATLGLATDPTALDGRSDYASFADVGIPVGGLFSGADGVKTAHQQTVYGGTAGITYDPCYHQACDDFQNVSELILDQMSDAVAHAVLTFAMTTADVSGTDKGLGRGQFRDRLEFRGNRTQK